MSNHHRPMPEGLQTEIRGIRGNLGELLDELGDRRRRAVDIRWQMHRRPVSVVLGMLACLGLIVGAVALVRARRRHRRSPRGRLYRLTRAARRAIENPDKVAKVAPSVGLKILAAGGASAVSVLAKRLAERTLKRRG
jgi:hypothetical protein